MPPGSSCLEEMAVVEQLVKAHSLCSRLPGFQSCRMICMAVLLFTPAVAELPA